MACPHHPRDCIRKCIPGTTQTQSALSKLVCVFNIGPECRIAHRLGRDRRIYFFKVPDKIRNPPYQAQFPTLRGNALQLTTTVSANSVQVVYTPGMRNRPDPPVIANEHMSAARSRTSIYCIPPSPKIRKPFSIRCFNALKESENPGSSGPITPPG
jgi:hypothetical protein